MERFGADPRGGCKKSTASDQVTRIVFLITSEHRVTCDILTLSNHTMGSRSPEISSSHIRHEFFSVEILSHLASKRYRKIQSPAVHAHVTPLYPAWGDVTSYRIVLTNRRGDLDPLMVTPSASRYGTS